MKFIYFLVLFLGLNLFPSFVARAEDQSLCLCRFKDDTCSVSSATNDEDCWVSCTAKEADATYDFVQGDQTEIDVAMDDCRASSSTSENKKTEPKDNPLCWSKDACEKDYSGDGKNDGEWDNTNTQAVEKCGGSTYGFCYAISSDYTLSVGLPNGDAFTKTVSDVGDYVNKMYLFMLGSAALFAVVRMMAAGIQYIAAPKGGEVSDAKKKFNGALTGLVILSCAALILATVNPEMLNLNPPRLPKIRTFVYFGDDARCESYKDLGYGFAEDLSYSEESTCGEKGEIITDTNGVPLGKSIECTWTGCRDSDYPLAYPPSFRVDKVCYPEVNGAPACISCEDITTGPEFVTGVVPSEEVCAQLQPTFHTTSDQLSAELGDIHAECVFNNDINFETSEWLDSKVTGQCAMLAYNCASIKKCKDYDSINVWNDDGQQNLDALQAPGMFDYEVHQKICETNPCGVEGGCRQDKSTTWEAALIGFQVYLAPMTAGTSLIIPAALETFTGHSANGLSCESKTESAPTTSDNLSDDVIM